MLDIAAACLVVTALLAYVNHRFIGLPTTIGVMAASLALSLLILALDAVGIARQLRVFEESLLRQIDFSEVLMQGMLSLLLFAGALHVDLSELKSYRWQIFTLAVVGTLCSTLLVGVLMWWVLPLVGMPLPFLYCLLFGALISPTDPIAVMGILKSAKAPKNLELVIAGESLFNDGVGVVIFALLLGVLASGTTPTVGAAFQLLLHEAGGGLVFRDGCRRSHHWQSRTRARNVGHDAPLCRHVLGAHGRNPERDPVRLAGYGISDHQFHPSDTVGGVTGDRRDAGGATLDSGRAGDAVQGSI